MTELLRFVELLSQTRPQRAYELLDQSVQPANQRESARRLELLLRLAIHLERKEDARKWTADLVENAHADHNNEKKPDMAAMALSRAVAPYLKPHMPSSSGALRVGLMGEEAVRLYGLAVQAWPTAKIEIEPSFPPPDVLLATSEQILRSYEPAAVGAVHCAVIQPDGTGLPGVPCYATLYSERQAHTASDLAASRSHLTLANVRAAKHKAWAVVHFDYEQQEAISDVVDQVREVFEGLAPVMIRVRKASHAADWLAEALRPFRYALIQEAPNHQKGPGPALISCLLANTVPIYAGAALTDELHPAAVVIVDARGDWKARLAQMEKPGHKLWLQTIQEPRVRSSDALRRAPESLLQIASPMRPTTPITPSTPTNMITPSVDAVAAASTAVTTITPSKRLTATVSVTVRVLCCGGIVNNGINQDSKDSPWRRRCSDRGWFSSQNNERLIATQSFLRHIVNHYESLCDYEVLMPAESVTSDVDLFASVAEEVARGTEFVQFSRIRKLLCLSHEAASKKVHVSPTTYVHDMRAENRKVPTTVKDIDVRHLPLAQLFQDVYGPKAPWPTTPLEMGAHNLLVVSSRRIRRHPRLLYQQMLERFDSPKEVERAEHACLMEHAWSLLFNYMTTTTMKMPTPTSYSWRRNDPVRVLVVVSLGDNKDDAKSWREVRSSWLDQAKLAQVVLFAPVDLSIAYEEEVEWVRRVPAAVKSKRGRLGVILEQLHSDPQLAAFDGYLLIPADCAYLGDGGWLPQPFIKSMVGGDNREATMIGNAGRMPPYGFNRAALSKIVVGAMCENASPNPNASAEEFVEACVRHAACRCIEWGASSASVDPRKQCLDAHLLLLDSSSSSSSSHAQKLDDWRRERKRLHSIEWSAQDVASDGLTIVTGLFDVRGRERIANNDPMGECRTSTDFASLGRPLLAWNCHMYIVTEPHLAEPLRRVRAGLGLAHKTVIEIVQIQDTDYYDCIEPLYRMYATGRIPNRFSPTKDSALYTWCMWQKYDCLRRALQANPFKSQSMYWIDLGIYHVVSPPVPAVSALLRQLRGSRKLRVTLLRQLTRDETRDRARFFSSLQQAAGGGLIGGPVEHVTWLRERFDHEARGSLRHGYPVLDEALLGAIIMDHPDRFFPIWSGHKEMFQLRTPQNVKTILQRWPTSNDARDQLLSEFDPHAQPDVIHLLHPPTPTAARSLRVGVCDGGDWFKGTLLTALRKHVGASLDGSQDAQKLPRLTWELDPQTEPHLLLFSQHHTMVAYKRYPQCRKLCVTGEVDWPGSPAAYPCDVQIAAIRTLDSRIVFVPFHVTSFWERRWHSLRDLYEKPKTPPEAWRKPRFAAFFYQNCVADREHFFDRLSSAYKPVDALGRSRSSNPHYRTTDRFVDPPGATLYDTTTLQYLPYKFVIAMEPLVRTAWVTEKIVNPMLAGAIPIYRGSPEIAEFFNDRSFINGSGKTDDEIVEMVRQIDQSPQAYTELWSQPWITEKQRRRWFESPNDPRITQLLNQVISTQ
jgi:hypothetical protein